jgi:hypothetical protein
VKRETFEELVHSALAADVAKTPVSKSAARHRAIGGIRYGETEQIVGRAVRLLAAMHHTSKPVQAPSPAFVPPCF